MNSRLFLTCAIAGAQLLGCATLSQAAPIASAAAEAAHTTDSIEHVQYWHHHPRRIVCHWDRYYHRRICHPVHRHW
jgi:hypothetical protein